MRYYLPRAGEVRLVAFDVLGRQVGMREMGLQTEGMHELSWSLGSVSNGMYFLRLEAAGSRLTRPFVVLK